MRQSLAVNLFTALRTSYDVIGKSVLTSTYKTSVDVLLEFQLFTCTYMKHSYQNRRVLVCRAFLENDLGRKLRQTKLLAVKGLNCRSSHYLRRDSGDIFFIPLLIFQLPTDLYVRCQERTGLKHSSSSSEVRRTHLHPHPRSRDPIFILIRGPRDPIFILIRGPRDPIFILIRGPRDPIFILIRSPRDPIFILIRGPRDPIFILIRGVPRDPIFILTRSRGTPSLSSSEVRGPPPPPQSVRRLNRVKLTATPTH